MSHNDSQFCNGKKLIKCLNLQVYRWSQLHGNSAVISFSLCLQFDYWFQVLVANLDPSNNHRLDSQNFKAKTKHDVTLLTYLFASESEMSHVHTI